MNRTSRSSLGGLVQWYDAWIVTRRSYVRFWVRLWYFFTVAQTCTEHSVFIYVGIMQNYSTQPKIINYWYISERILTPCFIEYSLCSLSIRNPLFVEFHTNKQGLWIQWRGAFTLVHDWWRQHTKISRADRRIRFNAKFYRWVLGL